MENWNRMAVLVKLGFDGSGPCDGSSSVSRMKFAWILNHRFSVPVHAERRDLIARSRG